MYSLRSADCARPAPAGFPPGAAPEAPTGLRQRGITLRPGATTDLGFLRDLYRQLRADELAAVPWPESQKHAFLDSQFALQHQHYLSQFPNADFLLIECDAVPIGRFYLLRQAPAFLVIDISLLPQWRNSGIGSALIRNAQAMAQVEGADLDLHVDQRNPAARRLYERLGFAATDTDGPYASMRWTAASCAQEIQSN